MGRSVEVIFGVVLVIIFLLVVIAPILSRLFAPMVQRWVLGQMEDRVRKMAGMPSRKEEKKARKREKAREKGGAERFRRAASAARGKGRRERRPRSTVGLLRFFAEDVEFTEIKEFGKETPIGDGEPRGTRTYVIEEQIEDVEFTEIKIKQS